MSDIIVRGIRGIKDIAKQGLNTNDPLDLLIDKDDNVYIRLSKSYYKLNEKNEAVKVTWDNLEDKPFDIVSQDYLTTKEVIYDDNTYSKVLNLNSDTIKKLDQVQSNKEAIDNLNLKLINNNIPIVVNDYFKVKTGSKLTHLVIQFVGNLDYIDLNKSTVSMTDSTGQTYFKNSLNFSFDKTVKNNITSFIAKEEYYEIDYLDNNTYYIAVQLFYKNNTTSFTEIDNTFYLNMNYYYAMKNQQNFTKKQTYFPIYYYTYNRVSSEDTSINRINCFIPYQVITNSNDYTFLVEYLDNNDNTINLSSKTNKEDFYFYSTDTIDSFGFTVTNCKKILSARILQASNNLVVSGGSWY